MSRSIVLAAILGLGLLLIGGTSPGDDKKEPVDEKALMEAMIRAGTPGENHKRLDAMTGKWDLVVKMWMDPSKPPDESKATSEVRWIMGNRYLEEKVTGDFGGQEFQGLGILGYDNLAKKYTSTWIDNFATSTRQALGTYNDDKKTITFHAEDIDPLSGQKYKARDVMRFIDKDHHESEMFKEMGGKEVKVMHIIYTRRK